MDVDEIFRPLDATGVRVLRVRRGIQFADPQTMLPKSTLKDWMATPYWQTRDRVTNLLITYCLLATDLFIGNSEGSSADILTFTRDGEAKSS